MVPWLGDLARVSINGAVKLESERGLFFPDFVLYFGAGLDFDDRLPVFGVRPSLEFDDFPELILRNVDGVCE